MSIAGIGKMYNHAAEYAAISKQRTPVEKCFALPSHTVQKSQMAGGAFVLHYFDNEEGEHAISAACGADYSVTVYEPEDYNPANPVYKVKLWDKDGNVTQRMVDISKVDPKNSDYIDMYAYSCHAAKTGRCPDALSAFMGADMGGYGPDGRTYKDLFTVKNWVKEVEDMMQTQYDAGNLQGYLYYKKFFDFLIEEEVKKKTNDAAGKAEEIKTEDGDPEEESESRTEVVVKPDGSKVLLMTLQSGGIQMTTSVELSKPDEMQDRGIQDGSIINDSMKNAVEDDVSR